MPLAAPAGSAKPTIPAAPPPSVKPIAPASVKPTVPEAQERPGRPAARANGSTVLGAP
ncbi:hypothetical protein ACFQX6_38695 [Streptosporangium lutulentum]